MDAIEARGLTREFGSFRAVDRLDLTMAQGETLALLGPNGAGKSTTVGMLTTLLAPTSGSARVAGHDVVADPHGVRAAIGVVFQGPSLELQLSARQNLRYHARLYKVPKAEVEERAQALLKVVELEARADEPVYKYSGGMRRRLEIVRGVLHRPRVLFLDEPTIGLDPQARLHTWDLLEQLRREEGMAILLTTHHMEEAERLAERVAIMDHGKLLQQGEPARLKAALGQELVRVRVEGDQAAFAAALGKLVGQHGVEGALWKGDQAHVRVASAEAALPHLFELAGKTGAKLAGLDVHRPTLEDVFIAGTGRALRDEPA